MRLESSCYQIGACRICGSSDLNVHLDLGSTPLANAFIAPEARHDPEPRFPLRLLRCAGCGLVQLSVVVDPVVLFRNYLYSSSASAPMVAHFDAYASEVSERFAPPGSLTVELGSNDGILLRPLAERGVRVLGVEPSVNLFSVANDAGLETWNEFFTPDVARTIVREKGRAAAVIANNVLAHIDDLTSVVGALHEVLDERGVFVAEFPYLADLLEHVEYDTIYHEHLSYFAVSPLVRLFERADLVPFDVSRVRVHGGSVRLFVGRAGRWEKSARLEALLAEERETGLDQPEPLKRFADRVAASRAALQTMIQTEVSAGHTIAALGATAKGNTLLNYCGIGPDQVKWIADSTPLKIGLLSPGMRIPIRAEHSILDDRPERVLLLAWNYADAIIVRFRRYLDAGGRFIHPIPLARLIP